MDKLNKGGMFRYIFAGKRTNIDSYIDLDYIRNILTILSNYSLENGEQYMPLENMVQNLHHITGDPTTWFDNQTWAVEREKVTQLLYYMNYYNRRENHWFQFVDIQCNDPSYNKMHIGQWEDLHEIIQRLNRTEHKIGIRITNAGKAYVGYIVQTFEFISCMEDTQMPLLCCLPTENELLNTELNSLQCVQIIDKVMQNINRYLEHDDHQIKYKRPDHDKEYAYTNRVINSHIGYLDNFCTCIDRAINSEDDLVTRKKEELIARIKVTTDFYRNTYGTDL